MGGTSFPCCFSPTVHDGAHDGIVRQALAVVHILIA